MKIKDLAVTAGVVLLVFFLVLLLRTNPALHTLELQTVDWRFQLRGPLDVSESPVVLVTIDDQSFESLPDRWPWPRYYYARVIRNLTRAGAKAIGLDVMLDVPDKHGKISDQQLADAIRECGNVVLTGKLEERVSVGQIQSFKYPVLPIETLLEADGTWGVIALQADPDGIYRRYFLAQEHQGEWLPSFGLQVLKKYFGQSAPEPVTFSEDSLYFAGIKVPIYNGQLMMINYNGPAGTFPTYSFDSVIDDDEFDLGDFDLNYFTGTLLPEGVFKDKIVLIGSTVHELHDNFVTPFFEFTDSKGHLRKAEMPGVEIHANAIQTILSENFLRPVNFPLQLLLWLLLIAGIYALVLRFTVIRGALLFLAIVIVFNVVLILLFGRANLVLEMVSPTLAMVLSFVTSNLYQYVKTQREKRMVLGAFARFVPESVVKELLAHPEKLQLGGEERFLTVLFLDLANFTSVSEKLPAKRLVLLINYFLTEMTDIILNYGGIIDKYEGDAIMAEFGAPVHFPDHALKACYAALEMRDRVAKLDLSKFPEVGTHLSCRIGINSGNMIVGNMGSKNVFDYTVMGDAVNLASRLEGANKAYGTQIMISYDTYQEVKDHVLARPLDLIRVKGRQKPVRVFELIARKDQPVAPVWKTILPVFVTGVKYYHHRNWDKAEECFRFCLEKFPQDGPSRIYLERVMAYRQTPPPEDWDGVFTMTSK